MYSMVAENLINNVLSLPIDDRLELYTRLRDSLQDHPQMDALSAEDKQVLDARAEDIERNPSDQSSWEDVEARLNALLKARQ